MYRFASVDTDDEDVVELLSELHDDTFAVGEAPLPKFEDGWWWIGTDGREAAAFCGFTQSSYHPTYAYLKRAGVLERHRGNGLQKRMITLRERRARSMGFSWAITDTTNNPASANSLISAGYRLWMPEVPWAFDNSLYWRKRL
jgi:GNAT superfamily N-acetyltransferase